MNSLSWLYSKCRVSQSSFPVVLLSYGLHRLRGKRILCNHKTIIRGITNIETNGLLQIGMSYVGFIHKYDVTYLNINGRLIFNGGYSIGKGCRFDIGQNAVATFGTGYVNSNTTFIIMHGLSVGEGCSIGWGCQFLDEDFHEIQYAGKRNRDKTIVIGDRVWIGCNVSVMKGASIADGCVVAAHSVVTERFEEQDCLIAGNPAQIVKRNIQWA